MDFLVKHLSPFRRRFPRCLQVLNFGDIREKDHWVDRTFSTCNFSFILRGGGEFRRGDTIWKVEAPCVLTQWPGERPVYGPWPRDQRTWDEIFLIYDARTLPVLRRRGFVDQKRPVWTIQNPEGFASRLEEARALLEVADPGAEIDRIDAVCEQMILETLLPPPGRRAESRDELARLIEARMNTALEQAFNMGDLAESHGMSLSTLQRQWTSIFPLPPKQYLHQLRMQRARQLLVETNQRVGEIAVQVGFEDVLYFSRRFHLHTGRSPTEYRKTFREEKP